MNYYTIVHYECLFLIWSFWQSGLLDWLKEIAILIIRKKKKNHKGLNKRQQEEKGKDSEVFDASVLHDLSHAS